MPFLMDYLLPSQVGRGIRHWAINLEIQGRDWVLVAHSQGRSTQKIGVASEVFFVILLQHFLKTVSPSEATHPDMLDSWVPIDQKFGFLLGDLDFGHQYSLDKALEFLSNIKFEIFVNPVPDQLNGKPIKLIEFGLGHTVKDSAGNLYFELSREMNCPAQIENFGPSDSFFHSSLESPLQRRLYRYILQLDLTELKDLHFLSKNVRYYNTKLQKFLGLYTKRFAQAYEEDAPETVHELHYLRPSHFREMLRDAENGLVNAGHVSESIFNQPWRP